VLLLATRKALPTHLLDIRTAERKEEEDSVSFPSLPFFDDCIEVVWLNFKNCQEKMNGNLIGDSFLIGHRQAAAATAATPEEERMAVLALALLRRRSWLLE
jgi:hypothetical protein